MQNDKQTWFERIPKVELHVHLEGAIPHSALWELIQKYGGDPSLQNIEALEGKFAYKDFPHFIQTWIWKNSFIREYEDFTHIAKAAAVDFKSQNIMYSEMFFSPPDFARHGLNVQEITEAVYKGISSVKGIEIALVADLVRDFGAEKGMRTLEELNEVKDLGITGIGIGGSEQNFPPELFAKVFEKAREKYGFHTSAHAGEAAGAESIWNAVNALRVERIGHGTRAKEDEKLVEYLADKQIPLEMCPVSNLRTGVVETIEDHPIRNFYDKGLLVTVNSDDPAMFNTNLAYEYKMLTEKAGFSKGDIKQLIINAVRSSWMSRERKDVLEKQIAGHKAFAE